MRVLEGAPLPKRVKLRTGALGDTILNVFRRLFSDLRDFFQLFFNPEAVFARDRRERELEMKAGRAWTYPR